MAWLCSDCGEEMRPEVLATGTGFPAIPRNWTRQCSKMSTEWGERWDHWVQHDRCADAPNEGRAEWHDYHTGPRRAGEEASDG